MKKMKIMVLVIAVLMLITLWVPACAEEALPGIPTEFFTWDLLGTCMGAAAVVSMATQLTKGLPYISKIPTQLWSYILAVLVLTASQVFTGNFTTGNACLILFNAMIVSLTANGTYSLITRVKGATEDN